MPDPQLPRLTDSEEARLLAFDSAWARPGVEELRAVCPPGAGTVFLLEVVRIDAEKRRAAGLPVEEAAYLEAFPALGDPAARAALRDLTFLQKPVGESVLRALAATTPLPPPVRLPNAEPGATLPFAAGKSDDVALPESRLELEGEIARGGMGAVLRGRDHDLGREIAVKVMLQTHAGKTELLQRFLEEAQIAGQLQHPGITPVYELGRFADQRPYFTMKLVRGQTLARLLKERTDLVSDRPRFLKVFEQVCQTLAYAHARKVIHRDLKPHNIMVGSFGEVQVMDWGLAKVLAGPDATDARREVRPAPQVLPEEGSVQTRRSAGQSTDIPNTEAGSVLGTPAYMAPEQARGEIDALDERADVFGLGAILCEILTGAPPYQGEAGIEIYRQAVDADLADAQARLERCGADAELTALARRCLAADRAERPRDAGVLATALTEYLHSVESRLRQAELSAVEARTKAAEEGKRRRVTVRLSAAILLTLVAGLAVSLWQMNRAVTSEARATTRLDQIEKGVDLLAGIMENLDPRTEDPTTPPLFVQLGERAARAADQLAGESVGDPLAVARLQTVLGATLQELGNYPKAISLLEQARDVRVRELGPEHVETLHTLNSLAEVYLLSGKQLPAIELYEQVREASVRTLGPDHRNTLMTMMNLGVAYKMSSRLSDAIPLLLDVKSRFEQGQGPEHADTLLAKNNLATAYLEAGKYAQASALLTEVYETEVKRKGPDHAQTLLTMTNLGNALQKAGKASEAVTRYEQIRPLLEGKLGGDHPTTLGALGNLAVAYEQAGQFAKARPLYVQVLQAWQDRYGSDNPMTLLVRHNLASFDTSHGRLRPGIAELEKVRDARIKVLGADHAETYRTLDVLAASYHANRQVKEAIALFQKVRAYREKELGPDHPDTLVTLNNLAEALRDDDQLNQAVTLLQEIRPRLIKTLGIGHPKTLNVLSNLASALADTGQVNESIREFEQLRGIAQEHLGPDHLVTLATLNNLGSLYWRTKQFDKSVPLYEDLLRRVTKAVGRQHLNALRTAANLGVNYKDAGRLEDAIPLLEEVYAAADKNPDIAWVIEPLLEVYVRTGKAEKAREVLQSELARARQALPENSPQRGGVLAQLGLKLLEIGDAPGAEAVLREALTLREKQTPDAWNTFNTRTMLGGALLAQKKYAEAEPLLLQGYNGMKQRLKTIPPQGRPRVTEALDRLVKLYQDTAKPDEAKKWQAEKAALAIPPLKPPTKP